MKTTLILALLAIVLLSSCEQTQQTVDCDLERILESAKREHAIERREISNIMYVYQNRTDYPTRKATEHLVYIKQHSKKISN